MEEKEIVLKKDDDVILFVKDEREKAIKLVNVDLREHTIKHREVLERFGRYPKRNLVLGRESSKDELDYIRTTKNPY